MKHADVTVSRSGVVTHRASGVVLGSVERWPDGAWITYLPYSVERAHGSDFRTRYEAVWALLDPTAHEPPDHELCSGTVAGLRLRDATEAESRRLAPQAWAHWDAVRPLFCVDSQVTQKNNSPARVGEE